MTNDSGIIYPSEKFIELIDSLQQIISSNINIYSPCGISRTITKLCFAKLSEFHLQTCGRDECDNALEAMTKLFIKCKIHFYVKVENRLLRKKKLCTQRNKLMKLMHN